MSIKTLGQQVQELRLKKHLTQEKLAELASMHTVHVGQIEQGAREPRIKTLKKIADALGVRVKDLIPF